MREPGGPWGNGALMPPAGRESTRAGWFLTALLTVATWNYLDRAALGILQEPIKREFMLSDFRLGLLGGPAFAILYVIMGIPFGRLAERAHRVRLIATVFAFWSVATALCGAATSFLLSLLARVCVSVGEAGAAPSAHSLISDRFPAAKRPWAVAVYTSGVSLGSLIAALAGGALAQRFGWRASFFVLGATGLAVALIFVLTVPEAPRTTRAEDTPPLAEAVRFLLSRRVFWHVAFGIMIAALLSLTFTQYLTSFFMRVHHLRIAEATRHVALIAGAAGALGTYAGGLLGNRLTARDPAAPTRLVAWAYFIAAPLFVIGLLAPSPTVATILLMVGTAAQSSYFGPTFAVLHATAEPRMRATAVALVLLIANLFGYGLGPPVAGLLSDGLRNFLASAAPASRSLCDAASWLRSACDAPNAGGLQWTLVLLALTNFWAFYHFRMISRYQESRETIPTRPD